MSIRNAPSLAAVCVFYAGTVFGFSFVGTPAKFLTPGVPMPELLLVGRTSFGVFFWVEVVFVVLTCWLAIRAHQGRLAVFVVAAVVALQYLGLRPLLDTRVTAIVGGDPPTPSGLHHVYGVLELVKLGVLLGIANATRRSHREEVC